MFRRDEQVSPPVLNIIDLHAAEEMSSVTEDEQSTDDELLAP